MRWGYAGVFPGPFGVWEGDAVMNKLRFVAERGFDSTGLRLSEMRDPGRREQIGGFVAEHGLRITVGPHADLFSVSEDEARWRMDAFVRDLEAYGELLRVPIATMAVGPYHRFMREPTLGWQMDRLATVLPEAARACHEMGRPLGIENHGDYYTSDLVGLCERVPRLGIFLDTGNTYLIGEPSVEGCRAAAPYTIGAHFKDHHVRPDPKTLTFVIEGAVLGEGDVGLAEVYADLMANAPRPSQLVMQFEMVPPKGMDPFECLERSKRFVASLEESGA